MICNHGNSKCKQWWQNWDKNCCVFLMDSFLWCLFSAHWIKQPIGKTSTTCCWPFNVKLRKEIIFRLENDLILYESHWTFLGSLWTHFWKVEVGQRGDLQCALMLRPLCENYYKSSMLPVTSTSLTCAGIKDGNVGKLVQLIKLDVPLSLFTIVINLPRQKRYCNILGWIWSHKLETVQWLRVFPTVEN